MMPFDLSRFIEGHLVSVEVQDLERIVRIRLRDSAHQCAIITISGVERFVVYEMRENNIVDRISIWDSESDETEFMDSLSILITGKEESDTDGSFGKPIKKASDLIRRGERVLLEIEPVYGAHVIALAEMVSVDDVRLNVPEKPGSASN